MEHFELHPIIEWVKYTEQYLYGCWPLGEDLVPGPLGISVHVDKDVDSISMDPVSSLPVTWDLWQVNEVLGFISNLAAEVCSIIRAEGVAERLHVFTLVKSRNALHQMWGGVISKIRADISNS